jgi:hypothetical protein
VGITELDALHGYLRVCHPLMPGSGGNIVKHQKIEEIHLFCTEWHLQDETWIRRKLLEVYKGSLD